MPAKVRFHKALTRELRRILKAQGISVDEEVAHYILGGLKPVQAHYPAQILNTAQTEVQEKLGLKRKLMEDWEAQYPGLSPYPPPFPGLIRDLANRALRALDEEDAVAARAALESIADRCTVELLFEP